MVKNVALRWAVLAAAALLLAVGASTIRSRNSKGERDERAQVTIPLGFLVHAQSQGVAVVVAEGGDQEAYHGTRWTLLFHQDGLPTRRIASGEGLPLAVWLSANSDQVLLGWIGRPARDSAGLRKVALFDTVGEEVSPITEITGQLLPHHRFGVNPWSRGGRRWLSLVQGGGNVIYAGGEAEPLRAVPRPLKAWLSERPGEAYVLDQEGDVHRISGSEDVVVATVPLRHLMGRVTAIGDTLFYLSEDQGTLARVDLLSGGEEIRRIPRAEERLGTIDRVGAIDDGLLSVISYSHESARTTQVTVSTLEYPSMSLTKVWSERFSRSVEECVNTAADLVDCGGDRQRLWVAWKSEDIDKMMLTPVDLE